MKKFNSDGTLDRSKRYSAKPSLDELKDEFRRRKEKGFDKYQDLAVCIYETCDFANKLRDDLTVVFIEHVDVDQ